MAKKEFVYTVKVNTDGVEKEVTKVAESIDDFEEGIAGLRDQLNKAPLGSKEFKKLNNDLKNAEKQFEKTKIKSQGLGQSLGEIGGPIGGVIQGIKGFGQSLKVLALNPVGAVITAIVVAVTALYKAFASTKKGAEFIERAMAGVSAAFDVLRDRLLTITSSWSNFTKIFTVDFWRDTANEIKNEATAAADLTGQLQRLKDQQRDLNTDRAKQNLLIADAKLAINDENKSYEERLAALEDVRKEEQRLADTEAQLAKDRYEALKALADQSDSSAEDLDALAAAEQEYYNKQLQSKQKQKELFDQEKSLRDRQRAEQKAAADKRIQELQKLADFEQQLMLDLIEDEDEKAREQLRIQRDADMEAIDQLTATEDKKQELRDAANRKYKNAVDDLEESITQKEQDEIDKREANRKAADQKKLDDARRDIDIRLGLQQIGNKEDLAQFEALLLQKLNAELAAEGLSKAQILQITEQYNADLAAAKESLYNKERAIELQKRELLFSGLDTLIKVAGEESRIGKGAAIATALINTYLGVSEVLSQESTLASPFDVIAKIVNTAAILATGFQAVKNIKGVKLPSFAEGGMVKGPGTSTSDSIPTMLSNGESVMNAKTTAMFAPLLSTLNVAGGGKPFEGELERPAPPINEAQPVFKTYVVADDVSTQVTLDRQVKSRSII
jgi:DNA repair exonuclease SbcCD ATPase subunit